MNLVSPKESPLAISSSATSLKDAEHVSLPEFNGAVLDLDGTLIDSVYQRVLSWQEAFAEMGYYIPAWELHRHIGMCADLLIDALSRMLGTSQFSVLEQRQALLVRHGRAFSSYATTLRPLPGARQLLDCLVASGKHIALATSGDRAGAQKCLAILDWTAEIPLVTREDVMYAKPDPEIFLKAVRRLALPSAEVVVIGDSIWDVTAAQQAGCLSVGLLSGGSSGEDLRNAGAIMAFEIRQNLLSV
jgi:HAD superfamily hydrolase (TIGR01509 family)